jgi:hypothetical protein
MLKKKEKIDRVKEWLKTVGVQNATEECDKLLNNVLKGEAKDVEKLNVKFEKFTLETKKSDWSAFKPRERKFSRFCQGNSGKVSRKVFSSNSGISLILIFGKSGSGKYL